MMSTSNEKTSVCLSSSVVAHNDRMVACELSVSTLTPPTVPTCPKVEVQTPLNKYIAILSPKEEKKLRRKQLNEQNFRLKQKEFRKRNKQLVKQLRRDLKIHRILKPQELDLPPFKNVKQASPHKFLKASLKLANKCNVLLKPRKTREEVDPIWNTLAYRSHIVRPEDVTFMHPKTRQLFRMPFAPYEQMTCQTLGEAVTNMQERAGSFLRQAKTFVTSATTRVAEVVTPYALDAYVHLAKLDIDSLLKMLDYFKPMTMALIISNYLGARDETEKKAVLCCMFEFMGSFWETFDLGKNMLITALMKVLDYIIKRCWDSVRDTLGVDCEYMETQGISIKEDGLLDKFLTTAGLKGAAASMDEDTCFLVTVLALIMAVITGGSLTGLTEGSFKKIFKRINAFSSSLKGIHNFQEFLPKVWDNTLSELGSLLGFTHTSKDTQVQDFAEKLLELKNKALDLQIVIKHRPWELAAKPELFKELELKHDELDDLYLRLMKMDKNMSSTRIVFDEVKELVKMLRGYYIKISTSTCAKQEPWIVVLGGLPGIGKSMVTETLLRRVAKRIGVQPYIYTRNSAVKHWDDYVGQNFVVYDDFGAMKVDLDHMEVMQYKNPQKTVLPMADNPDKGQLFSAIGCVLCTNDLHTSSSASIKCPEALTRRMEIKFTVTDPNREEFIEKHKCTPAEYQKFTGLIPMTTDEDGNEIEYYDRENFSHLQFWHHGSYACESRPVEKSFQEVVDMCVRFNEVYARIFQESVLNAPTMRAFQTSTERLTEQVRMSDLKKKVNEEITQEDCEEMTEDPPMPDDETESIPSTASSGRRKRKTFEEAIERVFLNEADELEEQQAKTELKQKLKSGRIDKNKYAEACAKGAASKIWKEELPKPKEIKDFNKARSKFISEFLRKNPKKNRSHAMVEWRAQHFMQAQSLPQPFEIIKRDVRPIIVISGPPGTGKSCLQTMIQNYVPEAAFVYGEDLSTTVLPEGPVILEDVSINEKTFRYFNELACRTYDGKSPQTAIIASLNPYNANNYFINDEDRDRLLRRCIIVKYSFKRKAKNLFRKDEYFTEADVKNEVEPYSQMVEIRCKDIGEGPLDLTSVVQYCVEKVKEATPRQLPIATAVPYVPELEVNPDFIVKLEGNINDCFERYYESPIAMAGDIMKGSAKLLKGSVADGIAIAKQFAFDGANEKPQWPGNIDAFIILNNNAGLTSSIHFVTKIITDDCILVIAPQKTPPGRIVMFKCRDELLTLREGEAYVDAVEGTTEFNEASKFVINDVFDLKEAPAQIESACVKIEEQTTKEIGVSKLLEGHDWIKHLTGIFIFTLKLFVAGTNIHILFNAAKERYQLNLAPLETETKKKNRMISAKRNLFAPSAIYDDFKDALRKSQPSAKKAKVKKAMDFYLDYYFEKNGDDVSPEDFQEFFTKVDPTWFPDLETREEKVVVAKPTTVSLEVPYQLETREEKVVVQKPATVNLEIPYSLEEIPKPTQIPIPQRIANKPLPPVPMSVESLLDPASRDTVDLTWKNCVDIHYGTHKTFTCHGLMVQGRLGVTVGHVYDPDEVYWVKTYLGVQPQFFKMTPLKHYKGLDLLIFTVESKQVPTYRSILGHFPKKTGAMESIATNRQAILLIPDKENSEKNLLNLKLTGVHHVATDKGVFNGLSYTSPVAYLKGMLGKTPVNTKEGDCGSVVIINDSTVASKIVGIHNAANTEIAHCSFLYQDLFTEFMKTEAAAPSKKKVLLNPYHKMQLRETTREALLGMPIVGEGDLNIHRPVTTNLWTSPLRLEGEQSYQPSIVSPYDTRNMSCQDPFYSSVAKWNNPQPQVDSEILDKVVEDVGYWYAQTIYQRQIKTKVLTKTEAINSGAQYNVMPINRQSAAGYPWFRFGKKQNFLINKGNNLEAYWGIDLSKESGKQLNHSIDYILDKSRDPGQYVAIPFSGWLKDEPLKVKKIYDVNTRSFTGAPFDFTIAFRMYFSTVYGAIHQVRDIMPIQVGINPTSLEWDQMTSRLLSVSDSGFDLDFQGFDSTVPSEIQKKVVEVINAIAKICDPNWSPEDDVIRRNLHQALVKPLIVVPVEGRTHIIQAPGGQPSGHPGTADENSIIHLMYLYYAYLIIMTMNGLYDYCNIISFSKLIQAILYGDDGVYMVDPSIQKFFNFTAVWKVMQTLGIKCTPAAKGSVIQDIIPLTECEFLKRDFVRRGKYWFGALKKKSFEKMLGYCLGPSHHWYKDQDKVYAGRVSDLIATAQSCLQEAIIHGKQFFDEMADHLQKKFMALDVEWTKPRYKDFVIISSLPLPLM